MSMVESLVLPGILMGINHITAVVKESMMSYPFFAPAMRQVKLIALRRIDPREDLKKVLRQGREYLQDGRSIILFPQATRSLRFDPAKFNTLGVKLAKSAGVPITPLALKTDFQRNGRIIKDLGSLDRDKTIRFKFGAPIEVTGRGKEAHEQVIRFISENLREWGAEGN